MTKLERWGGVECSVNRVGDRYGDQLRETGHDERDDDLDLLAGLGLSAIRYPVLWERVCAGGDGGLDWSWSDKRLSRLRDLGIRPIVGLVHHGSGPRHTSLVDPRFASEAARFAKAVAERYPWVEEWTPINEPLTTARFSALYGLWYPHLRDERTFWLALLNQIDAVRGSMLAIRDAIPSARLIQTEDLGRTYATGPLADQAAFDNARRWMTWDLLFGRVVPGHPLWERLSEFGLEDRLRAIGEDPCPPDIIGINHYLTSDRFLDHRVARYPRERLGGNGQRSFADVEAVRVLDPAPQGLAGAMDEAWKRYHTPIALTEVHNGCSREEQVRWLRDAWLAAEDARARGVDVQAVTSWALFGSSGWNTLLTSPGCYEPGVFDVRSTVPRATALTGFVAALPAPPSHPAVSGPGWWRRDIRYTHPSQHRPAPMREARAQNIAPPARPLLIIGATGTLGRAMARACDVRGMHYKLTTRAELDLLDPASIELALQREDPWAVINCSGWVRVDDAELEQTACHAVNSTGARALASACAAREIASATFSSDLVFEGRKGGPYLEDDQPAPLNVYGHSKTQMEQAVLALPGSHLIVRTAAFFSPHDHANFAMHVARTLAAGECFPAAEDCFVSPTYVPDLCNAALDLLVDRETGLWHLTNEEQLSWSAFALRIAEILELDAKLIKPVPAMTLKWKAKRPRASGLASSRGKLLPPLQTAIDRFASALAQL